MGRTDERRGLDSRMVQQQFHRFSPSLHHLKNSSGRPASRNSSPSRIGVSGVCSEGFSRNPS
jgi:hypothetical protein